MTKDFKEILDELEKEDFLVFHDVGDLLDLLHSIMDDEEDEADKPDIEVEITAEAKEEPKPEETKAEPTEEEELEAIRKLAKKQHDEIVELCGKEMADAVVDYAATCASIAALLRGNTPIEKDLVEKYNELTEQLHPEKCTPLAKALAYYSIKKMVKEGKESLEG